MPPKGKGEQPKVKKVAVDKTFGMKNKKGGAAQKQIAQIKATTASGGSPEEKRKAAEKAQREKDKAAAEAARKETAELFKPVQVQKVPFGTDPKTVLCQFFKKGNCEKGKKCKFSHDLNIERKTEKRSLYTDTRDEDKEAEEERRKKDNMDDWDEDKLRQVVLSKHGNPKTTTDKVCKYFIQAIEDQKYGWFWVCPNGGKFGRQNAHEIRVDLYIRRQVHVQTLSATWVRILTCYFATRHVYTWEPKLTQFLDSLSRPRNSAPPKRP
jgi:hypothetical protein